MKAKGIGSMLFLAVFLAGTLSLPAFAEDKEMADIVKGIREENSKAVSGAVKDQDKVGEATKPKCNLMGLMKEKVVGPVSKKARKGEASCKELASVEALLPKYHCELSDKSLKHFAEAKAKLKCGQVAKAEPKPDDAEEKAKTGEPKKADAGKEEPEKAAATLDLSKSLVLDKEKPLESAKKILAYFKQAKADCEADVPRLPRTIKRGEADIKDVIDDADTQEEILEAFKSAAEVPEGMLKRCIEEKGIRIADMKIFIKNLENMPAGTQFEWEPLDVANLNPDLVNGKHLRIKTKDGKEFEGKATLVGKNLVIEREGEDDELIPVANLAEAHLRKEVRTGGGEDRLMAIGYHFGPDNPRLPGVFKIGLTYSRKFGSQPTVVDHQSTDNSSEGWGFELALIYGHPWAVSKNLNLELAVGVLYSASQLGFQNTYADNPDYEKFKHGGGLFVQLGLNYGPVTFYVLTKGRLLGLLGAEFGAGVELIKIHESFPVHLFVEGTYGFTKNEAEAGFVLGKETEPDAEWRGGAVYFGLRLPFTI